MASPTLDPVLAELRALNRRFIHNFVTNDVASHDAILHPRFFNITSAGARVERAPYLQRWATGFDADVIPYWDMRDERIERFGDCAVVSATNRWEMVRNGQRSAGFTGYTDTYVREGGRWLCVLAQLVPVAEAHAPPDSGIVVRYHRGVLDTSWPGPAA